jgi:hypothetical protein
VILGNMAATLVKPLRPPHDTAQVSLGHVRALRRIAEEIVERFHDAVGSWMPAAGEGFAGANWGTLWHRAF